MTFDKLLEELAEEMLSRNKKDAVVDLQKLKQIEYIYNLLKSSIIGNDVTITCEMDDYLINVGTISISGVNISFHGSSEFLKAVEASDNFEVLYRPSGVVSIIFSFYGLTKPISLKEE